MVDEQFEFLLTQYLDGALSSAQAQQVEARLLTDQQAQNLLEEYRKLAAAMRAMPRSPEMQWDVLSGEISRAVAREPISAPQPISLPANTPAMTMRGSTESRGPVTPSVLRLLRPSTWVGAAAALAACLLITVGLVLHSHRAASPGNPGDANAVATAAAVIGPQIEASAGSSIAQVQLIPPTAAASANGASPDASATELYSIAADGVVRQPSHVSIVSAADLKLPAAPAPQ